MTERPGVVELAAEERLDVLAGEQVGRLAVSTDDLPDIFPINDVVDAGAVVVRIDTGTKLAAAVLGRGVAFGGDARPARRDARDRRVVLSTEGGAILEGSWS